MTKPLSRNELAVVGATDAELARALVAKARAAMGELSGASQQALDECVTALAWSHYQIEAATELAEIAVRDTGLGNVADKTEKVRRKTFGTLRDLSRVKSTGVIEESSSLGLVKFAKPVGVVAALCPTTNPASTAVNKAMMALKGGNAIVLAPSPSGWTTIARSAELMRDALEKIGRPADLVQVLPRPVTKPRTDALMAACDLVVATGTALIWTQVSDTSSQRENWLLMFLLPTLLMGVNLFCDIIAMRAIGSYYAHFKHKFAWSWG